MVLTLVPLAPAERDVRIEAERAVAEAVGRQEMAAKRAERARLLAQDGSGSRRAAEEAQADLAVADAALKAARDRLALAARGRERVGGDSPGRRRTRAVLRALHADAGQTVAAGAPLFDLVGSTRVWLRVPVYAGDVDAIDRRAPVEVVLPRRDRGHAGGRAATPVAAPPTADPATAGVDLFYRLANADRQPASRPAGERPRAPRDSSAERLVVPRGACCSMRFGGTWVYGPGRRRLRRVSASTLVDIIGDTRRAAIRDRPPGTRVVTTGAAELFGTEFGVGK